MALLGLDLVYLLLAVLLVLLNGFFVASEFALVKIRSTQVDALKQAGDRTWVVAEKILENLDAYLGVTQLGITAASLGLGWVGEPAVAHLIEPVLLAGGIESETVVRSISFIVAFSIITYAHVVVGELMPKSMSIRHPVGTTKRIARPMVAFYYISWPFMKLFNGSALLFLRLLGVRTDRATEAAHTVEEIEQLVSRMEESQVASPLARDVLSNVFWLRRLTTREIMTHRTQMVALNLEDSLEENIERARESGFARFPVIRGDIDSVAGIVHLKDIAFLEPGQDASVLLDLAHPPVVLPETATLDQAVATLLDANAKMAIVADEHGGTEGLVTTEDLLEELVGEIEDAFDEQTRDHVRLPGDRILVRGDAPLHDVDDVLGLSHPDPDVTTVAGVMMERLGRVPETGERVRVGEWELTAVSATDRRVREVVAEPMEDEEPPEEDEQAPPEDEDASQTDQGDG